MADAPKPAPKPEAKYEPPKELEQKAAVQKFQGRPKRQPVEQAEYFYSVKGSHIVFFLSSLAMLISFLMMFAKDDLRPWKPYQTQFSQMDFEKLWYDMNELQKKVSAKEEKIKGLDLQIGQFLSVFRRNGNDGVEFSVDEFKAQGLLPVPGLEKPPFNGKAHVFVNKKDKLEVVEKEKIRGELYRKIQLMNFAKDELGAVRFRYEEAKHHYEDAVKTGSDRKSFYEAHFEKEKKDWARVNKEVEDRKADADEIQKRSDFYEDFAAALEKKPKGATRNVPRALEDLREEKARELKELEAAKTRFEKEKPSFANTVRNAPGTDFFAPTLKVANHILPDLKDQLNFATVTKVDRCDTCHVGIGNPDYAVRIDADLDDGDENKYVFKNEFLHKFVAHARGLVEKKDCAVCDEAGRAGKEIRQPLTPHKSWDSGDAVKFTKAFMAHPRLDLFVSDSSKHGIARFGCTICHEGDGRDTDFTRVVHTPNSPTQGKLWRARHGTPYGEERYNWNYRELWDLPMFPTKYVQASCRRCHTDAVELDGGEKYVRGMKLVERVGCFGCHRMDTYQILPKDVNNVAVDPNRKNRRPGPPLTRIATKVTEDWAAKWVLAPRDFRPTTRMPHFFQQSNTRAEVNKNPYPIVEVNGVRRSQVDETITVSLVKYVWSLSDKQADPAPPALKGDAIKGELIVKSVGCTACHKLEETPLSIYQDPSPEKGAKRSRFLEEFAPTLAGVGSKMNKPWLTAWVKNPKMHFKESSMPNLRLSEQEAVDVVEYLMTLRKTEWESLAVPQANPKIVDDLITELLKKVMSDHDAAQTLAGKNPLADYKDMATPDGKIRWLGRKMVKNFGCYSCHKLKDDPDTGMKWEDEEGIGVELTGSQPWGSKHHDKLDFGFAADDGVNHHGVKFSHQFTGESMEAHVAESRAAWLENKLTNPRIFDAGKMASKPWDELLRMPNFALNRMEVELIATFIQSFTDHAVQGLVENAKMRPNEAQFATYRGDRIARENNCRACHRLSLDKLVIDWERFDPVKKKDVKTPVVVEGRFGREEGADDTERNLKKWKFLGETEDLKKSGKKLYTFSWASDHSTLVMPGAVNPDSKFVYFDGYDRWYLDVQGGEVKHQRPVLRYHPQDGGDIIPELRKFKKDLNDANKPFHTPPYEKYTDFMDAGNEGEFETRWAPMLRSQGVKTQTDWLFKFLKAPYPIRPTLQPIYPGAKALPDVNLRMPTFEFTDEESNSLVRWFAVRDHLAGVDAYPSTEFPERTDEFLKNRKAAHDKVGPVIKEATVGCAGCHYMAGSAPPGAVLKHAPDLARVEERLRPRWMYEWQSDPAAIYPGTTMTQYDFKPLFGGNQRDGVNAAVEYLLNFGKLNPKK